MKLTKDHQDVIDKVNREIYGRSDVLKHYQTIDFLFNPEQVLLEKLRPFIKDKKILDIGVGGGRTTKFLLEISRDYTAIDYSPGFVELVKEKYLPAHVHCCDARDLTIFSDDSFDLILFAFNGIDYMTHEDRIKALREIYRVLKPKGFFLFSTHNRDYRYFNKLPWQEKARFNSAYLKNCLYSLYYLPKHLSMKKHQQITPQYAIINDNAHGYAMLTYYIDLSEQVKQLANIGFESIEAYDRSGESVQNDYTSLWLYFLARK
jgi:ubiquinone/menaquinone biosynthesis C-methylase UbiE